MTGPLVIGHRGASGHRPEHTSLAYRLAWRSGADSVEPDVVSTRDGVLVCRHDLDLALTTDVASRPEFAHKRRRTVLGGVAREGWFVFDFDLDEIRQLRARERWPQRRRTSARYDDQVGVLTLEELLDLRERDSARAGRQLGVHVELKHPELFEELGLPLHEPLLDLLGSRRLTSPLSPVSVMSFDGRVLERVRRASDVELVRLVGAGEPLRRGRLQRIAASATAVGLHKGHLLASGERRGHRADEVVSRVFGAGLELLVWTLVSEVEVTRLVDLGVDGLLTDFPAQAVELVAGRARPAAALTA